MPRIFAPKSPPHQLELVAIFALLMSTLAFSTDSLLPALPLIAEALTPEDPSHAQLLVSSFMLGTGLGMLLFGPMADSFGRRRALAFGLGLFVLAVIGARFSSDLKWLLIFRLVQGFGAAASRTVVQTVTRDLFSGPRQAQVASLTFMFFVLVPAIAPLAGQAVIVLWGWRAMFTVYALFAMSVAAWFLTRVPETLKPENKRPFRLGSVMAAGLEVVRTPVSLRYLLVLVLMYAQFMSYISAGEQLYTEAIGVSSAAFPYYFALVALVSAGGGFINARLVMKLGMRKMIAVAFGSQAIFAGAYWLSWQMGVMEVVPFGVKVGLFLFWSMTLFFMNGMTMGNTNALAMEPLGHIAGTASSVLGALSIVAGISIAAPIGLAFDGTPRPIVLGAAICSALGFLLVYTDLKRQRG